MLDAEKVRKEVRLIQILKPFGISDSSNNRSIEVCGNLGIDRNLLSFYEKYQIFKIILEEAGLRKKYD